MKGTVTWFSEKKGYGFLKGESGADYFFDWRSLAGKGSRPSGGDRVVFVPAKGILGGRAINVSVVRDIQ